VLRAPRLLTAALTLALAGSLLVPAATLAANPVLRGVVVQSGLVHPWDVAFLPGGQMIVTERPGRVRIYESGLPGAALLGTTTLFGVRADGESGVMGIAVDHLFSSNRLVYVCVSRTYGGQWVNQLIRYKVTSSWTLAHNMNLISYGMRANTIHNGCAVEEGPDQKIWLTMGDGGNASNAQNPSSLNGKVLRIGRDGAVPTDNPIMPGATARTIVYSMGHRNPQGITFNGNRVYISEHGPDVNDEINWIRPGRNFGWPCVTGFGTPNTGCSGTFTNPIWASGGSTIATSNATFVRGSVWQDVSGNLFVATLKEQDLRRFTVASTGTPGVMRQTYFNNTWGRLRATVPGPGGTTLYVTTSNGSNDRVIRIIPRPS
jgi:glucose/arabinose dehydrogenase